MRDGAAAGLFAGPMQKALARCSLIFAGVAVFSGAINLLALTGSLYMLQVYDRVLPSRSVPTLIGLSLLMLGLYVANGFLDFVRVRVMSRVGVRIDDELRDRVFAAVQLLPLRSRHGGDGLQPVRDLDQIRSYLSGLGPTALFDLPWIPVYLAVIFVLHPLLGVFSVAGGLVLVALTFVTDVRSKGPLKAAALSASRRLALGEAARRNAEVIQAMGLGPRLARRWSKVNAIHIDDQLEASDAVAGISAISKVFRLLLQSGMLGLGAYLVIIGSLSAGSIIAASIIMSRSLAPIETSIAHWRGFVSARQSYRRLSDLFRALPPVPTAGVQLPAPKSSLAVENLSVAPPGAGKPVLLNVAFALSAGDALGIIGPSASGKSSLARALVGVWQPLKANGSGPTGGVRLDGATLDQWAPAELGRHIGYLPQSIELFDGTVADNICRFDETATSEKIIAAARAAGVHELIVHLPSGYETEVGEGGSVLSAGQRQRIALARALYGDPFLVVLDEPNANLDHSGDVALTDAILSVRQRGGIVIVVAHRPSALAGIDKVLALVDGRVQALGAKDEILRRMLQPASVAQRPAASSTSGLKVVTEALAGAMP
ncbi:type I secretion system permease/ATPase [Bradyrhizobium ontarionense]|uniref:Type I secretion system permease/ATPase n=1 Tax=Bradyrhizobium ontarionense TaxID=2898149 RepID=A0ABY3R6P0_9BRAD|nr:type I secretion system permease/ATPase [Bradyrhizobium sp. A19]UFZ02669.1 type I secretion system permease/ATPase [Bradyrhizobium sp. A19]